MLWAEPGEGPGLGPIMPPGDGPGPGEGPGRGVPPIGGSGVDISKVKFGMCGSSKYPCKRETATGIEAKKTHLLYNLKFKIQT